MVGVQFLIKGHEPLGPLAGDLGQLFVVPVGLRRAAPARGIHSAAAVPAGGGVDQPVGHRVLDVHPEEAGEDLAAGGLVRDQPPAWREGEERVGDDLAEHVDVGLACADDARVRAAGRRLAPRGHGRAP